MAVQWPLLIFSVLLGASSGILVFLGIGELKGAFKKVRFPLALCALVLLAVGGCASAMHLGHIDRALYILGNAASGLSKELFAVGFTGIMTLVYVILSRKDYPGPTKVFGILAAVGGLVLPLVAGASYMMPARPAWDSFALPLMYLGTGLGMGFVLAAAFVFMKGDSEDEKLALKLAGIGVVCSVAVMLIYVIWIAVAPYPDASRSVMRLFAGDLALAFWIGVVVIGIGCPIAFMYLARQNAAKPSGEDATVSGVDASGAATAAPAAVGKLSTANALWISLGCLVVGNVVLRIIMYLVATSVEQLIYIY